MQKIENIYIFIYFTCMAQARAICKLYDNGLLTIPRAMREQMKLKRGSQLVIELMGKSLMIRCVDDILSKPLQPEDRDQADA